jgi:spore germination cell wall hydrolase CwlJ-like protein
MHRNAQTIRRNFMEIITRTSAYLLGAAFVIMLIGAVITFKYEGKSYAVSQDEQTIAQLKKDLDCLAINVYREAGVESIEGKIAVAQVTMNRVAHPQFPNTVCGVVYEKNKIMEKVVCQFSWYCDSTHRNRNIHAETYQQSYDVAKQVLLENFRLPSLNEALFYHADYVNPRWKLERINQIGTHIFYKPRTARESKVVGT